MRASLAVMLWLAACGGGDADVDAAPAADARTCDPAVACAWLGDYQRRIVGQLAGAEELGPGVTLAHRASEDERDLTRDYLLDELAALGLDAGRANYGTGANVTATLLADVDAPGGLIVVGAHFDSVAAGPGAADNATGVALVLSLARYLRDLTARQHPITFAFFDEEEDGLIGSKAMVARLVQDSIPVAEAHVFDMLSFDGDGDRAVELWSPAPHLEAAYAAAGAALGLPIQPVTFASSDHQAFLDEGFLAVGVGEEFVAGDHTPHYHQATDVFANVDFTYLGDATRMAMTVVEASLRDGVAATP
ncbi:MAG: M20/M25/M40 family metallo-hydrolase [Kofleriaceae bacterium]